MFEIIAVTLLEKIRNITVHVLVILNLAHALTKNIGFSQIAVQTLQPVYICCNSITAIIA